MSSCCATPPAWAPGPRTASPASGDVNACAVPRSVAVAEPAPDAEVAHLTGAEVWDFTDRLCTRVRCMPVIGDTIAWYDGTHVSASFAPRMAGDMAERLNGLIRSAVSAPPGPGQPLA